MTFFQNKKKIARHLYISDLYDLHLLFWKYFLKLFLRCQKGLTKPTPFWGRNDDIKSILPYLPHSIFVFQEKRTTIEREFLTWLKECHEQCDKQIFFSGYKGQCVRNDLPKAKQTPWGSFDQVEWDGKTYKKGQMVCVNEQILKYCGFQVCYPKSEKSVVKKQCKS